MKGSRLSSRLLLLAGLLFVAGCGLVNTQTPTPVPTLSPTPLPSATNTFTPTATFTTTPTFPPSPTPVLDPLTIQAMRQRDYPGSDVQIEQTLTPAYNFNRYIASYRSEGLKIYALLTVPTGDPPAGGWPVIIFNHGYIPPQYYQTTERYVAYVNYFASRGYIVFKSDYRGHGNSEGVANGAYGSPDYTVDVLNALASMKRFPSANPDKIGMWGHSMGGYITLRAMVISKDIKAGVIWAGVIGSYEDMMVNWHPAPPPTSSESSQHFAQQLIDKHGTPQQNQSFWDSISAVTYLADLSGPLQLHHTLEDSEVPEIFSEHVYEAAQAIGAPVELYTYPGDDHNISNYFSLAMQRSVAFFDQYVK